MTRVIVVGAGIGGLATSIALKPKDVEVVLLERAPDLAKVELGTGVTLWPNAMLVLDKLGVAAAVRERGAILNCFEQRTARGRLLSRWPTDEMGKRVGAPLCGVNRSDLHAALAEAGGDSVRTGARVEGFSAGSDGRVEVRIEGGATESGDVLVGADGIESVIRKQLLGDKPLRHSGLIMWRATMDQLDPAITPGVDFTAWWGAGTKFIVFRSGPERWTMEAAVTAPPGEQDPPDQAGLIHERFKGFADPVHAIIDVAGRGPIFRTDVFDRPPDEKWGEGRVTLLGDAAHAMTFAVGQGAAQALEDALAIADAVTAPDLESALRDYEKRRMARAAKFQNMAWKLARAGALTKPPGPQIRNVFFVVTSPIAWRMQVKDMSALSSVP
jgi:2-polyprenyl-6-methoxyphenol hydroxylase-like FAD-dependent oxidoreductase